MNLSDGVQEDLISNSHPRPKRRRKVTGRERRGGIRGGRDGICEVCDIYKKQHFNNISDDIGRNSTW